MLFYIFQDVGKSTTLKNVGQGVAPAMNRIESCFGGSTVSHLQSLSKWKQSGNNECCISIKSLRSWNILDDLEA